MNFFSDIIFDLQDLSHLNWDHEKGSPSTAGTFLKSFEYKRGIKYYYKLSNYDNIRGVYGHESVNELIVSRLLSALNIEHLSYTLINAHVNIRGDERNTWITKSRDYRRSIEQKMGFEDFYEINREDNEDIFNFIDRYGFIDYFNEMLLIDYLILNRDRHGANIEVLISDDGVRLAPLFDHGLSLLFSTYGDSKAIKNYDVMVDKPVNNYIGAHSTEYNLQFISDAYRPTRLLVENDKDIILKDLNSILTKEHLDKIWEMIWKRWCYYAENFLD